MPANVIYSDVIDIQKFLDVKNRKIAENDPVIKFQGEQAKIQNIEDYLERSRERSRTREVFLKVFIEPIKDKSKHQDTSKDLGSTGKDFKTKIQGETKKPHHGVDSMNKEGKTMEIR